MRKALAVIAAIVLVTGLAAGQSIIELDEETELADSSTISEYEESGEVRVTIERYSLDVLIAEDSDEFDDLLTSDVANVWLHFEYRESIPRTFRIYIPREYFSPIPKKGVQSRDSDVTADLLPVEDREYTSVTIRFEGSDTATYAVSKSGGRVLDAKEEGRSVLEQEFNITLPSLTGTGEQWSFIEPTDLDENNETVELPINGSATVQYDDDGRWLKVPSCQTGGTTVCRFTRDGNVHVVSLTDDPPTVRYKEGQSAFSEVSAAWNDLAGVPSRIGDMVDSVLDSIF